MNDDVRVKAELLLSVQISPRVSHEKKLDIRRKEIKLSIMQSPRKKITNNEFMEVLNKKINSRSGSRVKKNNSKNN
jgi:uncharacterized protein YggU (UPF0235/DUF167 family)